MKSVMRAALAVLAGGSAWLAGFFALVILLAAAWPDFLQHGRVWQQQGRFTFTTPMACLLLLFWACGDLAGGWVAMKIAKRREAVWVLAGLLLVYVASLHLVLYWSTFPWWYNLGVVIPVVPMVLLGARLASGVKRN